MFSKLLSHLRIRHRRRTYRVGAELSRFVARDVRRDVIVVDASELDAGFITARIRTWNVLYAAKGLAGKPEFDVPERVEIATLWNWDGPPWGGPVGRGLGV